MKKIVVALMLALFVCGFSAIAFADSGPGGGGHGGHGGNKPGQQGHRVVDFDE